MATEPQPRQSQYFSKTCGFYIIGWHVLDLLWCNYLRDTVKTLKIL